MGTHQKIDRIARRELSCILPTRSYFPSTNDILHFEGKNGPDGIKSKSPARDEPWHYIDPSDHTDEEILTHIENHITNLTRALAERNYERAAFEAAWMSHAMVDGLTPAHHYPLSDKIEELWGKPKEERLSIKEKNIIIGDNKRDTFRRNWEYWGAKGVFTTHFMFEFGVASTLSTMKFNGQRPNENELIRVTQEGVLPLYKEAVQKVYALNMYEEFYKRGWTRRLAIETRKTLLPIIINSVILGWYFANVKAIEKRKK